MRETLQEYCIKNNKQYLLAQWHERNELTPSDFSYGSGRKVWWRCEKGHEWQGTINSRTISHGNCPYCSGKRVILGEDFGTKYPDIAKQWHPGKNGGKQPCDYMPGSHQYAWWICEKGHEWKAQIKSRVSGAGCPICANRKLCVGENDLGTVYSHLAQEWHPTKNGTLSPQDVVYGSDRKVWWLCEKGHEWKSAISSRVNGSGCPVCSNRVIIPGENDLASANPVIAAEWLQEKNGMLQPNQVAEFSNRRVWWQCRLGHQWQAVIAHRTKNGGGCPVCAGKMLLKGFNDLASQYPDIAKQWHPTLNGNRTPDNIYMGSRQPVWWQCEYGHVWKAMVGARTRGQGSGCPVCAGKVNQAKQRYYEQIEQEVRVRKILADDILPETVWEWTYTGESLAGRNFGRWEVQDQVIRDSKNRRKWYCRCECGTEKFVFERSLLEGKSESCGCLTKERVKEKLTHDLTNRTFDDLQALCRAATPEGKQGVYWTCRCVCGKIIDVLAADLTTGKKKNCGCKGQNTRIKDLTDMEFGALKVLHGTAKRVRGSVVWLCQCECGKELEVPTYRLKQYKMRDCGCGKGNPDAEAAEER